MNPGTVWVGKGTLKLNQFQPQPWAGTPSSEQVVPGPSQPGLTLLQGWGSPSLSEVTVLCAVGPRRWGRGAWFEVKTG